MIKNALLLFGIFLFLTLQGYGQALTITSPTSESIWVGGSTYTITWTGGTSEYVKIKFLWRDLGELTIVESTPNDGSYTWTLQDGYTGTVGIRIFGDDDNPIQWFTRENSAGGIYIDSPAYGYTWEQGTNHSIVWTDNISENVKIDLYYRRHELLPYPTDWVSTIAGSTPSDGIYGWDIPADLLSDEYEVCIESVSAPSTKVCTQHFDIGEPPQTCADEYEPNDEIINPSKYAFSSSIGGKYFANESIAGTLHESGDWDHYRINVEFPGNLDINLTNVQDGFDLQLYNNEPGGYVAGSFTDGDEYINVHLTSPDFYYIIVGSIEGAFDCSPYTLEVNWTADLFLDVTPASGSVGSAQGNTTFDVSSNANWSASEDASWLSVEKTSSSLLTVTYDENPGSSGRSADITVSADGVPTRTVSVTQEGAGCSLSVTPASRSVGPAAGTTSFTVTSNVSWSVNETADWLSTGVDGNTITVNYLENSAVESRNTSLTISGGGCSETVSVVQEGTACSLSVTPASRNVGPTAGTTSFTVTSNVSWSVNETADWLSAGVDGNTIYIDFDANASNEPRSAEITITGGECSQVVTVLQGAGEQPVFEVSTGTLSLGAVNGSVTTFSITSNVEWNIVYNSPWLNVNPVSGNGSSQVTVQTTGSNTTGVSRTDTLQVSGNGTTYLIVVTQDFVTGVKAQMEAGLNIYPNPSGSELFVNLGTRLDDFTVRIFDSRGSFLFSNSYKSAMEFTVDIGMFNSGIYEIQIIHRHGIIDRTFVKQ